MEFISSKAIAHNARNRMYALQFVHTVGIGQIGIELKLNGPLWVYNNEGIASGVAIGEAFENIRDGLCDAALAGGAEEYSDSEAKGGMLFLTNDKIAAARLMLGEILSYTNRIDMQNKEYKTESESGRFDDVGVRMIKKLCDRIPRDNDRIRQMTKIGQLCEVALSIY